MNSEKKFFLAYDEWRGKGYVPMWLYFIRVSTLEEDSQGADFVCSTDRGTIPIQIKSSSRGRRDFYRKHPDRKHILCLVVSVEESTYELFKRSMDALTVEYEKLNRTSAGAS